MTDLAMTKFAAGRHFGNPEFAGTKITDLTADEFALVLNGKAHPRYSALLEDDGSQRLLGGGNSVWADGYAPFCKHLFIPNFTDALTPIHEITGYRHLLQVGYEARREEELPVLTTWFDRAGLPGGQEKAQWLDIILYSKEQLRSEGEYIDAEWGIVSINAVPSPDEIPMKPITMMRNALGKEEGGSGVPLDREAYEAAVAYWSNHATIR